MHLFWAFLAKYFHGFLFFVLEIIALFFFFKYNNYAESAWLTSANSVIASINQIYGETMQYIDLRDVNRDYIQRNIQLQLENQMLRESLAKLNPDTSLTAQKIAENLKEYKKINAEVISSSLNQKNNYIVINKGSYDGIKEEMGVVGGGGVVGIIAKTTPHYALVLPIINGQSYISCRLRKTAYFGYLKWNGGSPLFAEITDVPRYAKPQKGVVVETSGYSAVFPPGIFIGRVVSVYNSADGLSYTMRVNLGTDFRCLKQVQVIATAYKAERDYLKTKIPVVTSNE